MQPKGGYGLPAALVLVGIVSCVGGCRGRPQGNDAAAETAVVERSADSPDEPTAAAPGPGETTAADASGDGNGRDADAADPDKPAEGEPLTEERFVDIAVKIRVWQKAIADTPEGERKLKELVQALLDSEGLTRADLVAFGETLSEADLARIDEEIDERVAELGGQRFQVEPLPTEGSKVIEDDADADGPGE
ncbi:MAG: hypothetical protein PVH68_04130 [Armatimonadota bacterium]|jgi:hypothetical protein